MVESVMKLYFTWQSFPAKAVGTWRLRRLCWVLLAASLLSGCEDFQKPVWDASDKRVLIVPFSEPDEKLWYGWSRRGQYVVRYFKNWVEDNWATDNLVMGEAAEPFIQKVSEWNNKVLRAKDWRELSRGLDSDVLVIGEIADFRHKQPNDVNIYQGSAELRYHIIECATGKERYENTREVKFPVQGETDIPFSAMDYHNNPKKIEKGLLKMLGERLGKDLYGYYNH